MFRSIRSVSRIVLIVESMCRISLAFFHNILVVNMHTYYQNSSGFVWQNRTMRAKGSQPATRKSWRRELEDASWATLAGKTRAGEKRTEKKRAGKKSSSTAHQLDQRRGQKKF